MEVANLLTFNFRWLIHTALIYPGSWHDSKVAYLSGLIYSTSVDDWITARVYVILCDSDLTARAVVDIKIVRACMTSKAGNVLSVDIPAIDFIV